MKKEKKKTFVPITSKNSASVHILHTCREHCVIKTEIVTAILHVVFAIVSPFEIYRLIFSGHAILL